MSDEGHGLLLPFDASDEDDAAFCRGFEAGRLWERAKHDPAEFEETVRAWNAEMVIRIGEATGREVRSEELGDEWLEVTFAEMDA